MNECSHTPCVICSNLTPQAYLNTYGECEMCAPIMKLKRTLEKQGRVAKEGVNNCVKDNHTVSNIAQWLFGPARISTNYICHTCGNRWETVEIRESEARLPHND